MCDYCCCFSVEFNISIISNHDDSSDDDVEVSSGELRNTVVIFCCKWKHNLNNPIKTRKIFKLTIKELKPNNNHMDED